MWSRKRIDIGWADLWYGLRCTYGAASHPDAILAAESALFRADQTLATLSVRSGFDLLLQTLALPPGSEILMSAVTITDMARVIEEHGLVPVPIDLDPSTMGPDPEALRRATTPKSKAVLVAHLFGAILNLGPLIDIAKQHGILFIEDCAQAFDGNRYHGHPKSDVVLFSFGPIKTSTALAGGILLIRDAECLAQMRASQKRLPVQSTKEFRKRIRSYALLKFVSGRLMFGLLMSMLRVLRLDPDATLNGAVRNFPADELFKSLRQQPCAALLKLMARRLTSFDVARQDRRASLGAVYCERLAGPLIQCPSSGADRHTWWVFPVVLDSAIDAQSLTAKLAQAGFDATAGSQMTTMPFPPSHAKFPPTQAQRITDRMMFLPLYPELSDVALSQMADLITETVANIPVADSRLSLVAESSDEIHN